MPKMFRTCTEDRLVSVRSLVSKCSIHELPLASRRRKTVLTALSIACSLLLFMIIERATGYAAALCAYLPAATIGLFFGVGPGVCAGALCLPLTIPFLFFITQSGVAAFSLSEYTGCILAGTAFGYIHRLLVLRETDASQLPLYRTMLEAQGKRLQDTMCELNDEITRRAEATWALNSCRAMLDAVMEISHDPVMLVDRNVCITHVNKACCDMFGYPRDMLIGKHPIGLSVTSQGTYDSTTGETLTIDSTFFDECSTKIKQLLENNTLTNWESYFTDCNNRLIPITQNITLIRNRDGEIAASCGVIRNRTEQRRQELLSDESPSDTDDRTKALFLDNISHELRTPINGVMGFTDILLETELNEEQREYAQTIQQSGNLLHSLINDILDFSQFESGKTDTAKTDFDLDVLIHDVCDYTRPRIGNKGLNIFFKIGNNVPALINGDPKRLRQVLLHLMSNAVKFTGQGEVELSVDCRAEHINAVSIHFQIRDTGIGIDPSKLDAIFETFYQVDASPERKYGGAGLGLSICKNIADLYGWEIWAESTPDKGSTFHLVASFKKADRKTPVAVAAVSISGKKALLADADADNREIMACLLEAAGMQVTVVADGNAALENLAETARDRKPAYGICITDIILPDMNGYTLAKKIRSLYESSFPLLAFASTPYSTARRCSEAGFDGFLPQPIQCVRLLKMLEHLMGRSGEELPEKGIIATQHSLREEAKQGVSILLAEDNLVNQRLAEKMLTRAGYQVTLVDNGHEVVDAYTAEPGRYNLILMDIQMPGQTGIQAAKQIRGRGFHHVPIVAVSANAEHHTRDECLLAGMNGFIPKPMTREAVFEALNRWVL